MAFEQYNESGLGQKYLGINLGHGAISVSINLHRKFKDADWKRADVFYDKEANQVKFVRNNAKGTYVISWSQSINSKLGRDVMPRGRYLLTDEQEDEFVFTKED